MCANSPGIFTLSVHAASNFPARKQTSSLDVPLADGLGDEEYLAAVAEVWCVTGNLFERCRAVQNQQP
jgi:acetoin utilization deacetylase AcuC-like enzyme